MNIKGQSLIEFILIFPLFLGFWAALVWFARVFIVEIELMHTARHGVFWLVYNQDTRVSPAREERLVEAECRSFLQRQDPSVDLNRLVMNIQTGNRWQSSGSLKLSKNPFQIFSIFKELLDPRRLKRWAGIAYPKPASVTLSYALPAPPLLRAIKGFPESIPLRAYCVCYR